MSAPLEHLSQWIDEARWFGGKGREWTLAGVRRVGELPDAPDGLRVAIELAEIAYADGSTDYYQLPLAFYSEPQDRLSHAQVGEWDDAFVYDALHDRQSMALWLAAFASHGVDATGADAPTPSDKRGELMFHRLPGHDLDVEAHSTLFSGEQSNSSVAFGEDALMKVFRKVTPGVNPDIAIHQVLTEAGSTHVAALYGWLDLVDDDVDGTDSTIQLAMLQQFLRTASDGWDLALASVRNLFAEADLHADEVGGDFAGEAARLGTALAEVHADLAAHFPVEQRDAAAASALADAMEGRLDAALDVVPDLAPHVDGLRATFGRLRDLDGIDVQQVHGDLHLGQTLRTVKGLEDRRLRGRAGQAARRAAAARLGLARRRRDDPLVRLRPARGRDDRGRQPDQHGGEAEQRAYRAAEWAARNRAAFLEAYTAQRGTAPDGASGTLLDAYLADKVVYEAVYEARNRPGWLSIPLAALEESA